MLESTIERHLRRRVRRAGGWALKFVSPSQRGVPDRIVFLPDGTVLFVELKAPGEKPTPQQAWVHRKLRQLKQTVLTIDSIEGVDQLFDVEDDDAVHPA